MEENIKIYVGNKSKEIQNKLFELGYKWPIPEKGNSEKEVQFLDMPFIFAFCESKNLANTNDNRIYQDSEAKEISFEELMSMEKEINFYRDLLPISGFYIDPMGVLIEVNNHNQHYASELWNVYPTKELAEANKVLSTLTQWRDRYNKGWTPNYENKRNVITNIRGNLELSVFRNNNAIFSFKDRETAEKFFNDFREQLEIVKPLI